MLPQYCSTAWRLDPVADDRAERTELREWTLSTLAEGLLEHQLSIENHLPKEERVGAATLASTAINNMIDALIKSENSHEDMEDIATTVSCDILKQLLNNPRLPYFFLRFFASRPEAFYSNGRSLIDIDEAIIRHEGHIRSSDLAERSERYLITLEGLLTVVSSATRFPVGKRMAVLTRKDPPVGGFEMVDDLRTRHLRLQANRVTFASTFKRITKGILDGLDWDNVLVAGGMVLTTLLHTDPAEDEATRIKNPDIDIYIYGVDADVANRKTVEIHEVWLRNLPRTARRLVTRNTKTIELLAEYPNRRLQIVLKLASTPLDVLLNFDLDACAVGFTGSDVVMLPRCARAIETGYNTFTMELIWGHHLGRRRETRIQRIFKYADRGFGLRILPSFAKSLQSKDLEAACALPRGILPHISAEGESRPWPRQLYHTASSEEPGLKALKRIAYIAKSYVHWQWFWTLPPQCGPSDFIRRRVSSSLSTSVPTISLHSLTRDQYEHGSHAFYSKGLRNFETLVRCCEVWHLEKQGKACFHMDTSVGSHSDTHIGEMVYPATSTYIWDEKFDTKSFSDTIDATNRKLYQELAWKSSDTFTNDVDDDNSDEFHNRLSRRVRSQTYGLDITAVLTQQLAVPVLVPHRLQNVLTEHVQNSQTLSPHLVNAIYLEDLSTDIIAAESLTSSDTFDQPSWKLWVVDRYTMWAGQHRIFDEIAELMRSFFYLFKASTRSPRMNLEPSKLKLARCSRRRIILPEVSDYSMLQTPLNNRNTSLKESMLFRPWVSQVAYPGEVHHALIADFNSPLVDKNFWQDEDEGTWDDIGAPLWTDAEVVETSDVTASLAGLTVDVIEVGRM